ncbi:retrovirus-related pol polyprotein from transposon TNT 1-94 [Tanacetum coccineum]
MEEYIGLEEEKARRCAIVFNDTLTLKALLCEPTVSSLNNYEIDFRILFDESNDDDCMIFYTAYPNPMDTTYRLSGRYPIFIFSTVYTAYSLNEYSVFDTGPRERKIDDVGDVFTNMEILKSVSKRSYMISRLSDYQKCKSLALLAGCSTIFRKYYQEPVPQRSIAPCIHAHLFHTFNCTTRHKGKRDRQTSYSSNMRQFLREDKVYTTYQQNTLELLLTRDTTEDTSQGFNNDNQSRQFGNQRTSDKLLGLRETVGRSVVQKTGYSALMQGFGHYEGMQAAKVAGLVEDTDEEIDEQELEAHYSYMAKIQETILSNLNTLMTLNVLEKDDSNVIPDSSNICTNDNQVDQNATESVDERVALANLIANLTLDTEENKTVLKQLKKANASLTQELKECKTNLDESSRALGEATSSRDSSLIALQTKQTELEKYTALNDLTRFCPIGKDTADSEKVHFCILCLFYANTELALLYLHNVKEGNLLYSVSRPQLKSYQVKEKVVPNISQVKFTKKEVEDQHRISSISKKTKSVTACNDSSNSRSLLKSTCFVRELQDNELLTWHWLWIDGFSSELRITHLTLKYTWTLFLRSKDETPEVLKDFLTMIQRNLQAQVITVRTDRGTEFLNKTLHAYFKEEGIEHQTSTPRTLDTERRCRLDDNRTRVEAARTMLSASKLPIIILG